MNYKTTGLCIIISCCKMEVYFPCTLLSDRRPFIWTLGKRPTSWHGQLQPAMSFRTLNRFFPCGHQSALTSRIGAQLSRADHRLFLASIVIDVTRGRVLAPRTCHGLYEIAGFGWVPTATAHVTVGESFLPSGHTLLCQREIKVHRG